MVIAKGGASKQFPSEMMIEIFNNLKSSPIILCLALAITYVGSLYIWKSEYHGDHPVTIKSRFISVLFMTFISPAFVYYGTEQAEGESMWCRIGVRHEGFILAMTLPLLLTMVLFLGPLVLHYIDGVCGLYFDKRYWISNLKNLVWIRTHLVAPFSEELTFRACMIPLLKQRYSDTACILICPLFFGIAHLHHVLDRLKRGMNLTNSLKVSAFQFLYTTIFGAYSVFLFLRTGHLVAPVIVHVFCNHMGFPDFGEVMAYQNPKRIVLSLMFVVGLVVWMFLLFPLTNPSLFHSATL